MSKKGRSKQIAKNETTIYDYVIVGGGISGLYAAYRLAKSSQNALRILIIESAPSVGGRLLSVPLGGFTAELGPMRFFDEQLLLRDLIDELDLARNIEDFGFSTTSLYVLRGVSLTSLRALNANGDRKTLSEFPYNLQEVEARFSDCLLEFAIAKIICQAQFSVDAERSSNDSRVDNTKKSAIFAEEKKCKELKERLEVLIPHNFADQYSAQKLLDSINKLTMSDWRLLKRFAKVENTFLHEWGMWDLLAHFLSNEAVSLLRDSTGYNTIFKSWNAAEAIPWLRRDFSAKFKRLRNGMEHLTIAIKEQLDGMKIDFMLGSLVTSVGNRNPSQSRAQKRQELAICSRSIETLKENKPCYAKAVILAIPKRAIQNIKLDSLNITLDQQNEFVKLTASVRPEALAKLFMVFDTPWWKKTTLICNHQALPDDFRVVTDYPARQLYYFGASRIQEGGTRQTKGTVQHPQASKLGAMIMASYSDGDNALFWASGAVESAVRADMDPQHDAPSAADSAVKQQLRDLDPGTFVKARAARQLVKFHYREAPTDVLEHTALNEIKQMVDGEHRVVFRNWLSDGVVGQGLDGGWHAWMVGERSWIVMSQLAKPFTGVNLYVCGEAFSTEQGWIEGALKSTELVLSRLGVKAPQAVINRLKSGGFGKMDFQDYLEN